VNNVFTRQEAVEVKNRIKLMPNTEKDYLLKEARDYNNKLTDNVILTDPFDQKAYDRIGANYNRTFNVDSDGLIGYIEIPKINVYLPIRHGTSEKVLAKCAGHLENTSFPVGGKSTHAIISAHSAYPGETFFDYLTDIDEGDEFYVHVLDHTLKYEVDKISVVLPQNTKNLRIKKGEDMVTLVTCTPYSINTHRLLVRGKRVPFDEAKYIDIKPPTVKLDEGGVFFLGFKIPYIAAAAVIISIVAATVAVVVVISKRRKKKAKKT
jgi:sortase A